MKFDARVSTSSDDRARFIGWLSSETESNLRRAREHADPEQVKSSLFLYANRAFEAHLPEAEVSQLIGQLVARAGYSEAETENVLDMFELFAQVAAGTHAG